jgi:hypothetical protein
MLPTLTCWLCYVSIDYDTKKAVNVEQCKQVALNYSSPVENSAFHSQNSSKFLYGTTMKQNWELQYVGQNVY